MKNNVFIMGDSYSTYEGYIPEGYHFYYSDERKEKPIVKGVEKTWWKILANENNNIFYNCLKIKFTKYIIYLWRILYEK